MIGTPNFHQEAIDYGRDIESEYDIKCSI